MTTGPETVAAEPAKDAAAKPAKRRRPRRIAKILAYTALTITAVMVLAEPLVLIPIGIAAVAISLWD